MGRVPEKARIVSTPTLLAGGEITHNKKRVARRTGTPERGGGGAGGRCYASIRRTARPPKYGGDDARPQLPDGP